MLYWGIHLYALVNQRNSLLLYARILISIFLCNEYPFAFGYIEKLFRSLLMICV